MKRHYYNVYQDGFISRSLLDRRSADDAAMLDRIAVLVVTIPKRGKPTARVLPVKGKRA